MNWCAAGCAIVLLACSRDVAGQTVAAVPGEPSATERALAVGRGQERDGAATGGADRPGGLSGWIRRRVDALSGEPQSTRRGFSGDIGVVTAGSGLAVGIGYEHTDILGTGLGVETDAMVSIRRYQSYRVAAGALAARHTTTALNTPDTRFVSVFSNDAVARMPGAAAFVDVRFRDFPQHMYYGQGIDSLREARADYALTGPSFEAVYQHQRSRALGFALRAGLLDLGVGTGRNDDVVNLEDRFPLQTLHGGPAQRAMVVVGGVLVYDRRTEPRAPADGGFLGVAVRRFQPRGEAPGFTRLTFDGRTYRRVGRGVIAVRGLSSLDLAPPEATPFYLQESLGGGETLRGYRPLRFQDRALLHLTAELRWRAHRFVDVAPFVDTGTTGDRVGRLGSDGWRSSAGVGIRARSDARVFVRLDWAASREGQRLILSTGPFF